MEGLKVVGRALKEFAIINETNCPYCGKKLTSKNVSTDHGEPKSQGGRSSTSNYLVCCKVCNNNKKKNKNFYVFIYEDKRRLIYLKDYILTMSGYYYYSKSEGKVKNYSQKLIAKFKIFDKILDDGSKNYIKNLRYDL